ncbi:cell division protein FtsL [Echinimonas agarilytica]|uniref:Cell division protein FtsL n=1 Tax=Echinimonas agarilytica TaxID=1215918 RepID=A0AA42B6H5_9GAMM|nr:cell division protein FtsL [Echinimonas agarilytica]MCM2678772.1 cell division protein FtsL [Echinimonas agarilytica]
MSQPLLVRLMLRDVLKHKVRWTLAIAVMFSAFGVVQLAYDNRQLTADADALREQRDRLEIEWRHLMLEESALAEHSRVSRIATKQYSMVRPSRKANTLVDVQ